MIVICPSAVGAQQKWRVGRRRLAWRPRFRAGGLGGDDLSVAIWVFLLFWYLLNWTAALLATAVAWPFRVLTGRWMVVAYKPDDHDDHRERRRWVNGRAAADSFARELAVRLEKEGALARL